MRSNYKRLGDYIREVDVRNKGLKVSNLLGLTINKQFIPSVANTIGTDMENYKIIRKNQFACSTMQVRRDGKMPVALLQDIDEAIISQAYSVFEVTNKDKLLPDYLMMWFSRSEFDREACFHAVGGVRGSLEWEDFLNFVFPVPYIDKQREIVAEYNAVQKRIDLNNQLITKLEETAQAIYKEWFVDFEFPNEEGKPYKSSNGEMDDSMLGKIPKGWIVGVLFDLIELQRGFDLPTQNRKEGEYPIYASTGISENHNEYRVKAPGIVTGRSGSLGEVFYIDVDFWPLNTTLWVKHFKKATPIFSYYILKGINILDYNGGSAVPTLNRNDIHRHQVIIPEKNIIEKFEKIQQVFFKGVKLIKIENQKLTELKSLLLSKMATIGAN